MPKAKPDQVIVHRIELQEKERELLDEYAKAKVTQSYAASVNKVVLPVVVVAGAGIGYLILDGIYDFAQKHMERFKDGWDKSKEGRNKSIEAGVKVNPLTSGLYGMYTLFGGTPIYNPDDSSLGNPTYTTGGGGGF